MPGIMTGQLAKWPDPRRVPRAPHARRDHTGSGNLSTTRWRWSRHGDLSGVILEGDHHRADACRHGLPRERSPHRRPSPSPYCVLSDHREARRSSAFHLRPSMSGSGRGSATCELRMGSPRAQGSPILLCRRRDGPARGQCRGGAITCNYDGVQSTDRHRGGAFVAPTRRSWPRHIGEGAYAGRGRDHEDVRRGRRRRAGKQAFARLARASRKLKGKRGGGLSRVRHRRLIGDKDRWGSSWTASSVSNTRYDSRASPCWATSGRVGGRPAASRCGGSCATPAQGSIGIGNALGDAWPAHRRQRHPHTTLGTPVVVHNGIIENYCHQGALPRKGTSSLGDDTE